MKVLYIVLLLISFTNLSSAQQKHFIGIGIEKDFWQPNNIPLNTLNNGSNLITRISWFSFKWHWLSNNQKFTLGLDVPGYWGISDKILARNINSSNQNVSSQYYGNASSYQSTDIVYEYLRPASLSIGINIPGFINNVAIKSKLDKFYLLSSICLSWQLRSISARTMYSLSRSYRGLHKDSASWTYDRLYRDTPFPIHLKFLAIYKFAYMEFNLGMVNSIGLGFMFY